MKKQKKIFITGTDTEVGKTFFTVSLVHAIQNQKRSVIALKPVAAGGELDNDQVKSNGQIKNEDALLLLAAMNEKHKYQTINPIVLKDPIAPHIAAKIENIPLNVDLLKSACDLNQLTQEFILIEGAGGWLVPLNGSETMADYVKAVECDVIMVVGMKLGCINHALLTKRAIESQGSNLIGWVANHVDPNMLNQKENLETLKAELNCPLIAEIPFMRHNNHNQYASSCVKIEKLDLA